VLSIDLYPNQYIIQTYRYTVAYLFKVTWKNYFAASKEYTSLKSFESETSQHRKTKKK